MNVTVEDYGWIDDEDSGVPEEYCLTLVRGLNQAEFLVRIGAEPEEGDVSWDDLGPELWSNARNEARIGVTEIDGWAVGIEFIGFLGITPEIYRPLSAGTRLVSHFCDVNAHARFLWVEDGEVQLDFDPIDAGTRWGATPDALNDVMEQIGFRLDPSDSADADVFVDGSFALAEHLTGIRLISELLANVTFQCGVVRKGS